MKHNYPKNVYELRETLFDKSDAYKIPNKEQQKLFNNLAASDFEPICVKQGSYKEIETTKWIGKHVPISVCISSNLIQEPILFAKPIRNTPPPPSYTNFSGTRNSCSSKGFQYEKFRHCETKKFRRKFLILPPPLSKLFRYRKISETQHRRVHLRIISAL